MPGDFPAEHPGTYYDSGDEGERHREHLLHLFFAEFARCSRQMVTQALSCNQDLFLQHRAVLADSSTSEQHSPVMISALIQDI